VPVIVPCHRVIGANGSLTGYGGGLDAKRWLLAHEAQRTGVEAFCSKASEPSGFLTVVREAHAVHGGPPR
jgi:hypothetical protein